MDVLSDYAKGRASDAVEGALGAVPLVGKRLGKLASKGVRKGIDAASSAIKDKVIGSGAFGGLGNVLDTGFNRLLGTGLYPPGMNGGGLLPKPIRGVNSNSAGI